MQGERGRQRHKIELLTFTKRVYLSKTFIVLALNTYLFSLCKWVLEKRAFSF